MKIYFNHIFFNSTNATYSYLTNLEVMQLLVKIKSTKKKFGMRNLATVTYEVSKSYIRKLTISMLTNVPRYCRPYSIWRTHLARRKHVNPSIVICATWLPTGSCPTRCSRWLTIRPRAHFTHNWYVETRRPF